MRLRAEAIGIVVALVLACGVVLTSQETQRPPAISDEQIDEALAAVKSDPNLGGERKTSMLRWREADRRPTTSFSWLSWIAGFFAWMMQTARYLVWVGVAVLAAWLGVYVTRALGASRATEEAADAFVPPTHVRNLDIRPESLPSNIGGAARALWERGDHRGALSLLYRGMLSRLTHVHRVPIADSSTEGDCLLLLASRVPARTGDYATRLVDAWRTYVYGGTEAQTPTVYALCDGFAAALDRMSEHPTPGKTA